MNAGNWIAVLGIVVSALGIAVTVLLFALSRLLGKLDATNAENKVLLSANWDLRLSIIELKGTAQAWDRMVNAMPAVPGPERKTP